MPIKGKTNIDAKLRDLVKRKVELGFKLRDRPNIQDNYWEVKQWEQANKKLLQEMDEVCYQIKIYEKMAEDRAKTDRLNRNW